MPEVVPDVVESFAPDSAYATSVNTKRQSSSKTPKLQDIFIKNLQNIASHQYLRKNLQQDAQNCEGLSYRIFAFELRCVMARMYSLPQSPFPLLKREQKDNCTNH
jgi:hypothetical protein